jgi:hypothetical protein
MYIMRKRFQCIRIFQLLPLLLSTGMLRKKVRSERVDVIRRMLAAGNPMKIVVLSTLRRVVLKTSNPVFINNSNCNSNNRLWSTL